MMQTDRRLVRHVVALVLVAVGLILVGTAASGYADLWKTQRSAARLTASAVGGETTRRVQSPARPYPWTLEIPRLQLSTPVLEGTAPDTLRIAAGHILGTRQPGSAGTVGIAAHRDTLFRPLRSIRLGDRVDVLTRRGRFEYVVTETRVVAPDDTRALRSGKGERLVLVTCYPFSFIGAAPERFVVTAERADTTPMR